MDTDSSGSLSSVHLIPFQTFEYSPDSRKNQNVIKEFLKVAYFDMIRYIERKSKNLM